MLLANTELKSLSEQSTGPGSGHKKSEVHCRRHSLCTAIVHFAWDKKLFSGRCRLNMLCKFKVQGKQDLWTWCWVVWTGVIRGQSLCLLWAFYSLERESADLECLTHWLTDTDWEQSLRRDKKLQITCGTTPDKHSPLMNPSLITAC